MDDFGEYPYFRKPPIDNIEESYISLYWMCGLDDYKLLYYIRGYALHI